MNVKNTKSYIIIALLVYIFICFAGCVIKQDINKAGSETGEITENETTEENIDSTETVSKYDMSVVKKLPYEQNDTGKWSCEGYSYDKRVYISGVIPGENVRTTFVVLCQYGCGTFESITQTAMESKTKNTLDSNIQIVEHIKHDYAFENGKYISEDGQEEIEIFDSIIKISDLSVSDFEKEYNYIIEEDYVCIINDVKKEEIYVIDSETIKYKEKLYIYTKQTVKDEDEKQYKYVLNYTGYTQYDELLDKMSYINETNPTQDGYRSIGVCYVYGYPGAYDTGAFCLLDLDKDGTEEMLLGSKGQEYFYDIYSIKEGKLVQVCSGGERDVYKLCKDNIIWEHGSSGAAKTMNAYYTYSDGTLDLIEGVRIDGTDDGVDNDNFLFNSEIDEEHGKPITAEEASTILNKYENEVIEFTSFRKLVCE